MPRPPLGENYWWRKKVSFPESRKKVCRWFAICLLETYAYGIPNNFNIGRGKEGEGGGGVVGGREGGGGLAGGGEAGRGHKQISEENFA